MSRISTIKSIFWLTFSEILFNLSGYIIHAVAGRTLGPADYGRYSLVITLTTVIVVLIGNGIPTAMSKYLSEMFETRPEMVTVIKRQSIKWQTLIMSLVTIGFFLLSPVIAWLLNDPTLTPLFQLSSLIIPAFAAASFYFSYFTGLHLFNHQSILKSFRSIIRIVVIVGLVLTFGLKGAIAGYILAPLITFFLGLFLDYRLAKKHSLTSVSTVTEVAPTQEPAFDTRKLLRYAWPITLFMLFYEIFISADLYLIKALLKSDNLTGLYNAALTIGRIPYYLFYALSIFLLPTLSKIQSENNPQKMSQLMTQSFRYAGIVLLPVNVFIISYAAPLTQLFFGNKYAGAIAPLQILVVGLSFLTLFYLLCSALNGVGHARISLWLAMVGTLFSLILNTILIRHFDIMGAAYATTISGIMTTLIALLFSQKYIPITFHPDAILKTILVACGLWFVTSFFPSHNAFFIINSIVLGGFYLLVLFQINIITAQDIACLRKKRTPAK
jgi:stage V sporulation protein B